MPDYITYRSLLLLISIFLVSQFTNTPLYGQEKKPKLAEFGVEPLKPAPDSAKYRSFYEAEPQHDSIFLIQLSSLSTFYQSARLIISLTNRSGEHIDHLWFQVRLLTHDAAFLYREQPVMFTNISPGQKVSYEVLCESIYPKEIGYVVLRPELIELNRNEKPLKSSLFELSNATEFPLKVVLNTRFQ